MEGGAQFRVACFGDSHTRAVYGYDWVGQNEKELRERGVVFGRFGVNGELAYHAEKRLGEVVGFEPDLVVILLGSNDVNAISTEKFTRLYMGKGDLPQVPDKSFFVSNMWRIIDRIRSETAAEPVLVSIPLLGEDLASRPNQLVGAYNQSLKEISEANGLELLDFYGELERALGASPFPNPRGHYDGKILMRISLLRHRLLFQSWNRIANANGLYLLTDTIHLNERAGRILASLVRGCILSRIKKADL